MSGRVILVGAGPGDPGLITVKGRDALAAADVVVTLIKDAEHRLSRAGDIERILEAVAELSEKA